MVKLCFGSVTTGVKHAFWNGPAIPVISFNPYSFKTLVNDVTSPVLS
jgi:hypothetical protein